MPYNYQIMQSTLNETVLIVVVLMTVWSSYITTQRPDHILLIDDEELNQNQLAKWWTYKIEGL